MKKLAIAILSLFLSAPALAFDIPELKAPVNDYAHLLTAVEIGHINERLRSIEAASQDGTQFVVLTLPSLADESIDKVRNDVFHAWKLGRKGTDNGVLFIVAPVERKIGIEVGYGLEPYLTDGLTKSITEEKIKPYLKKGSEEWFKAIDSGVQAIGAVVISREKPAEPTTGHASLFWPIVAFGGMGAIFAALAGVSRSRARRQQEAAAKVAAAAAARQSSNPYVPRPSNLTTAAMGAGVGYAMASKSRPSSKPTPRRTETSRASSSYDNSPSYGGSSSSSSSWGSSSSDSGGSFSGGGGDSGGGGSSSDF